uniref:Uncharacterized protein n=1 Tax=Cucumis sativus TaxID=3659 RepID=A0A0A0LMF4_CUCSA
MRFRFGWHCRIRVWRALYRFPSWLPLCDFNRFKFSRHPTETRTQSQPLDLPTVDNGRVFAVHEDIALPNERYKYRLIHLHTTKFKFKLTEIYFLSYCGFSNTNLDSFCIYLVLDVEDQAMKISIQEHMHFATIQTMENDLNSGQVSTSTKSELKQLNEDAERMMQAKGEICSQILEKQRKIASLESDISILSQTLELIQQEKVSLGAKIIEKSTYYTKVAEDISLKFQDQQDWVNANMIRGEVDEQDLVKLESAKQASDTEGFADTVGGISSTRIYSNPNNLVEREDLLGKLESAEAKLSEVSKKKCAVVLEKSKIANLDEHLFLFQIEQSIEELKNELNDFKPELRAMDDVTLEEEYKALLSDQAGETEYSQSLQDKIAKLKGISSVIKCTCGKEYKAGVGLCT